MALLSPSRKLPKVGSAAPSRAFPDTPAAHATRQKTYVALVTVPAADDANAGRPVVQYLDTPAAHATNDLEYVLKLAVTGDDTTGGSTATPSWALVTAGAVG